MGGGGEGGARGRGGRRARGERKEGVCGDELREIRWVAFFSPGY